MRPSFAAAEPSPAEDVVKEPQLDELQETGRHDNEFGGSCGTKGGEAQTSHGSSTRAPPKGLSCEIISRIRIGQYALMLRAGCGASQDKHRTEVLHSPLRLLSRLILESFSVKVTRDWTPPSLFGNSIIYDGNVGS